VGEQGAQPHAPIEYMIPRGCVRARDAKRQGVERICLCHYDLAT
jgi:hypothetical protein